MRIKEKQVYIWTLLYASIRIFTKLFSEKAHADILLATFDILFWALLVFFIIIRKHQSDFGLQRPKRCGYLPIMIVSVVPIISLFKFGIDFSALYENIPSCFGEEIAFRVVIVRLLEEKFKLSKMKCVIISSACFGLFHLLNLFSGVDLFTVIWQVIFAFFAGFAFCGLKEKYESILVGAVIHYFINITSGEFENYASLMIFTFIYSLLFVISGSLSFSRRKK